MFLPVDIVVQSIVKRTFEMLIFLQGFIVNNNLPSPAQQVSGQDPAMQENSL